METLTDPHWNATVASGATWTVTLLLVYSVLGVLSLVLALLAQRRRLRFLAQSLVLFVSCRLARRRGVQAVHECLWALLLADVVNAAATVALAAQLGGGACSSACTRTLALWVLSKGFMEGLHLLCALLCILFIHKPQSGTRLQLVATFVALLMVALIPFYMLYGEVAVNGEWAVNCSLALAIMLSNCYHASTPGKVPVVLVAMVTFFFVYLPKFFIQCLKGPFRPWSSLEEGFTAYENFLFFTNFQLVLDGFLCFCILKLPLEEQQSGDADT
ncbi:unnamed protein product [Tetraodon nigroviridis]|uniref:(spotted green pufferfish) hypothetical protein n=1 Tax=Tetraodon nigroviridis TaxID=99883 RepID=Q4T7I4_TETNG|nr:unnamed protein product [Tetraodon nigroviridis]